MADSPQTVVVVEEEVPLNQMPGSASGEACDQVICSPGWRPAACGHDPHHRKLAICSIICGFSCIGIRALINSVKAEEAKGDDGRANVFSRRARKLGIISIVAWLGFLAAIPVLMAVVSYLLTLQD